MVEKRAAGQSALALRFASWPAWFSFVALCCLGATASLAIAGGPDSDGDGIADDQDNCIEAVNPNQVDTDADGIGNLCDPDFNQDCTVNFIDLGIMRESFFTNNPLTDLNSDGATNFGDLTILRSLVFAAPGPSGLADCGACEPPDPVGNNADFAGLPIFVRGGLVTDWGAVPGLNSLSDQGNGLYIARFEASQGNYEFKVADEGWSIEYCSSTAQTSGVNVNLPLYGCSFPANGTIEIPADGCYEFTMQTDGSVPPLSVDLEFNPTN